MGDASQRTYREDKRSEIWFQSLKRRSYSSIENICKEEEDSFHICLNDLTTILFAFFKELEQIYAKLNYKL